MTAVRERDKGGQPRPNEQQAHPGHISGLEKLNDEESRHRFQTLSQRLAIGLKRHGRPTTADGGLLAIQTGIAILRPEIWKAIPDQTTVPVVEFGGTKLKLFRVTKTDGSLVKERVYDTDFAQDERQMTFDAFITTIASPLADTTTPDDHHNINFGVSLAFPQINIPTRYGVEAELLSEDGKLTKEWQITDWEEEGVQRNIVQAIQEKLGITNGVGIVTNDTPGVTLDVAAAMRADREGFEALRGGIVGGSGINGAVSLNKGIINTEIGQAPWEDDQVAKRMRERLIKKGILQEKDDKPIMEHELGQYLPLRLAAVFDLLQEQGLYRQDLPDIIESAARENQTLMSDLAAGKHALTGDGDIDKALTLYANIILTRAAQVYGILAATIAEPVLALKKTDKPAALLTEGSALLNGYGLKSGAEQEAERLLGQKITLYPASSTDGIAALTMSWNELQKIRH